MLTVQPMIEKPPFCHSEKGNESSIQAMAVGKLLDNFNKKNENVPALAIAKNSVINPTPSGFLKNVVLRLS
jgi:hypothetical protein